MMRVLVVQTAWLGDVVLTTPLLAALAAAHGPVDVVTTPGAAPLLAPHPAVRTVVPYDKHGRDRGVRGLLRVARTLRTRRYAVAYLPQGSVRSALLALLARVPRRITRAGAPGAWLCTERVTATRPHEAERHLALAGAAGPAPLTLRLTADDLAAADAALARAGVGRPFVALAPGSARATKRWPHFGGLARGLAGEVPVVVVGAPEDRRLLPSGASGGPMADLTGLPVRVSAAVIARAAVVVANDSLALHLGQAVGTPAVALFGPTHPSLGFGPRGPQDLALGLDLPCRPCSAHGGPRCPLGHHHCLTELAVPTVRAAVHGVLASREVACV
jgi:heptosyltransferase-2